MVPPLNFYCYSFEEDNSAQVIVKACVSCRNRLQTQMDNNLVSVVEKATISKVITELNTLIVEVYKTYDDYLVEQEKVEEEEGEEEEEY